MDGWRWVAAQFADMLEELERKQKELGIGSYGISATTLEEVFLRVAQGKGYSAAVDAVAAPVGALKPTSAAEPPVFLRGGTALIWGLVGVFAGSPTPYRGEYVAQLDRAQRTHTHTHHHRDDTHQTSHTHRTDSLTCRQCVAYAHVQTCL